VEAFIKNLAKGAGAILRDGFRTKFKVRYKNGEKWSWVTKYDLLAEKYIIQRIRKKFPNHGILSEESGHIIKRDHFWVVDPLDGTVPFSKGAAGFAVSLAFVRNNKLEYGAVYDPMDDEMFFGKEGHEATLNGQKIRPAQASSLDFLNISFQPGSARSTNKEIKKMFSMLAEHRQWPVNVGSAALALCYVAAGRYDACVSTYLSPWDYAGGATIIEAAGGKVTDFLGRPYRWDSESLVAANPAVQKKIIAELK